MSYYDALYNLLAIQVMCERWYESANETNAYMFYTLKHLIIQKIFTTKTQITKYMENKR